MKKVNKKISLFLIFTLIIGMITLNETTVNAAITKEINILEIESSESYYFSSNNIDGYKVNVEKIGMPEFIGRIDQLNGKYDVIIIGNKGNAYTNPFSSAPDNIYHNGSKQSNGTDNHIEYYPENDITNKRAEEIKTLIYSGQLVYMESSILSGTSLNETKLYSNFKDVNKSNFKKVSISNLNLNTIVDDYKNLYYENKRPTFELTKTPDGDESSITLDNRNMIFTGTITPNNQVENLIVNLYVDINGDSLFRKSDSELVATTEVSIKDGQESDFEIKYTMPSDFIGSLDWKVEVERKCEVQATNTTKNYETGSVVYKSISGDKQRINVIQVYLNEVSKLENNSKFKEKIKNLDYDIKLTYYTLKNFNTDIGSGKLKLDNFDMVIIGFDDSFWNNYLTKESSEKLKEFIATGQSVMFTHDTVSLSYQYHTTTQEFRDILGQSRFTDTKYNSSGEDILGNEIEHDTVVENSLESGKWTLGYTKGHIDRYNNGSSNRISTTVYKINSGLISQYPFNLGNETIKVKDTHTQYYQLNLEDPDLVPWYVLHDSYYINKDARSNYYTYSIGNLTYSGTGHLRDLSSYGTAEIELFINTIVKASRGANNAPTIYALNDTTTEVSSEANYDFNAIVRDLNGDKVKINEVIVDGTLDSTGNVQQGTGENIWVSQDSQYYDSGSNFSVTIPQNILNKNTNKEINITIKAQDEKGAISEKTYKIKPVATPILKINDYEYKGLVGDMATIELDMIKQNESQSNKIKNISVTKIENNFIDISNITVGSNNKISITFSTKGLVDGDTITLPVTYKVGNSTKSTTAKIILYTKEGTIKAKVMDSNGNNITEVSNINTINNSSNISYTGVYNLTNKSINYNNITSGNYNLSITQLPIGAEIIQGQGIKNIIVSYENNDVEVIFNVNGSYILNELPIINTELVSGNIIEVNPVENDEVEIKYSIIPESFELSDSSGENIDNTSTTYTVEDAKLYFDLNDNFTIVESYNNLVNITGNKYYLPINKIEYTSSESKNENGKYTYTSTAFEVSFKVKIKEEKLGQVTFAENIDNIINNYMQYSVFSGNLTEKLPIDTPIMNINKKISINANLISTTPNYPYLDDDITVTYEIDPKDFIKENTGDILLEYANLIFNLGSDFTLVEGQEGITIDKNGNVILNLTDKIKYSYDTTSNKYTSEKFNVSFNVKANRVGENITFISSKINYNDILSTTENIEGYIESPIITVRNNSVMPEYIGADIRILEVEPADSFKLTDLDTRATTGVEKVTRVIGDKSYSIEITHMTMAEFIGKVDDLNGKYDAIVLGRYVDKSLISPNGTVSNVNNGEGSSWFRDYIDLENDITNKKATEIKEYINSGQLVFIDSTIKDMNGSKLWWHTTDSAGEFNVDIDNLVKTMSINTSDSSNKITIDSIINKYINRINTNSKLIRPNIVANVTEGDSHDDDLGKIYKRDMRFNINGNEINEEKLTINLYLDINGDGLFKDEEIVKSIENVNISENGYAIDYNLYNDYPQFIGYLEWRIEVVKENASGYSNSIKSYVDGNILFRRVTEEKRVINVLQVSPFDKNNLNSGENSSAQGKGGNLNLKTNTNFQNLLKEKEVQDYEINIEVISYQDFYSGDYKGPGHDNLNGSKYHMIIMGFADTFLERQLSTEAREQLRSFIESGQGLMLTHDTLWYKSWDGWQSNIRNTTSFIKEFRDIIGQSRYVDPNNEDEVGLNSEKIIHDPNRPTNSYPKEAGATLLEMAGVNNSNSTEVYRTNESLITNYPFELGETIRVRRTHGQYLQLNFEDEDVVPLFNLTENNTNNPNNDEYIEWNHQNNEVNRYDSRNSYYTYSRGNITFSGTGENSRESVEYPDSELRLFINTIVKAERGANHKPEITALENIIEVPYNSDLIFNAIVKDVDGDKVRINNITVDSIPTNGYLTPTEYKEQGTAFPVTISANNLENKVDQEIKIIIEAEDSKGAVTIKEYIIIPVQNPLLTSSENKINCLVGETVEFQIKLNRENDTNPSSISIQSIDIPETFGKLTLKDVVTKDVNGEYYLVGSLIPLVELRGEEISIIINYNSRNSELKKSEAKIILNSKNANVNVIVKGNESNLGIGPKITLLNSITNKIYEKNISITDGKCVFDRLDSGKYKISISGLVGYTVTSISINQQSVDTTNNIEFDIDYDNSSKNIEIIVEAEVSDLTHGMYEGISSERIVNENINGFEIAAGMNVNFGSTFILGGNSMDIKLTLDSYLDKFNDGEEVNKNNIRVYKVVESNDGITLSEFLNESLEIKRVNSEYNIKIKDNIQSYTKILITYSAKIPDNIISKTYNNNIDISGTSKGVKVYTRDTGDKPAYLPDLF